MIKLIIAASKNYRLASKLPGFSPIIAATL
jgi:hypothetical protein